MTHSLEDTITMAISITQQSYGKSQVRLSVIKRQDERHDFCELTVDIGLDGEFDAAYTDGDNASVIPTDTMKNTVYAVARKQGVESIETFAEHLATHFQNQFDHVRTATVLVHETLWTRIASGESQHAHAFTGGGSEQNTCTVIANDHGIQIMSGLQGLKVLKTTESGFVGYHQDAYTTLAETTDRIFATTITANWTADPDTTSKQDWTQIRKTIRGQLLDVFANRYSPSVQKTLHDMSEAVLAKCPSVDEISLKMPNQHHLPADLAKMNLQNDNDIFVPTSEPFGVISATLRRDG